MIFNMVGSASAPDITIGATATPETILSGYTAGVGGELITGVYVPPEPVTGLIQLMNFDSSGYARKVIYDVPDIYGEIGRYMFSIHSGFINSPEYIAYADEVIIKSKTIADYMFHQSFRRFGGKVKVFAETIDYGAFSWFGVDDGFPTVMKKKIWFSGGIKSMNTATHSGLTLFDECENNFEIYCEPTSKPSAWGKYWNYRGDSSQFTTHWGVSEAEFDAL